MSGLSELEKEAGPAPIRSPFKDIAYGSVSKTPYIQSALEFG